MWLKYKYERRKTNLSAWQASIYNSGASLREKLNQKLIKTTLVNDKVNGDVDVDWFNDVDVEQSAISGNLHHGAAHLPRNGIESDRDVQLGDELLQLILPTLPAGTIVYKLERKF